MLCILRNIYYNKCFYFVSATLPQGGGTMKGQQAIVAAFVGIMVVVLIGVSAIIPTVQTSISDANFNGTLKTITDNIPLFLGIAILLFVVGLFAVPRL